MEKSELFKFKLNFNQINKTNSIQNFIRKKSNCFLFCLILCMWHFFRLFQLSMLCFPFICQWKKNWRKSKCFFISFYLWMWHFFFGYFRLACFVFSFIYQINYYRIGKSNEIWVFFFNFPYNQSIQIVKTKVSHVCILILPLSYVNMNWFRDWSLYKSLQLW